MQDRFLALLLLCNIAKNQKDEISQQLEAMGWEDPSSTSLLSRHAIACPALPTCGLAVTESERVLPHVLGRLETLLDELNIATPILVRMTGCPNGCARPYMAELAMVGSGVEQYQLWLGGSPGLTRLARPVLQKMPLAEMESTLRPLLVQWQEQAPKQSFGDYCHGLGGQLEAVLQA